MTHVAYFKFGALVSVQKYDRPRDDIRSKVVEFNNSKADEKYVILDNKLCALVADLKVKEKDQYKIYAKEYESRLIDVQNGVEALLDEIRGLAL